MKMQGYNGSQLWDTSFAAQVRITEHHNDYHSHSHGMAVDLIVIMTRFRPQCFVLCGPVFMKLESVSLHGRL